MGKTRLIELLTHQSKPDRRRSKSRIAEYPPCPSALNARGSASVVRQTDGALFKVCLARVTFARMSDAFLVQMNGFGWSLW